MTITFTGQPYASNFSKILNPLLLNLCHGSSYQLIFAGILLR